MQTKLDIPDHVEELPTHDRENNEFSEQHLIEHKTHFRKKVKQTFDLLMTGHRLTQLDAANQYHILSLSARISDLTSIGFLISRDLKEGTRIMEYWMDQVQIQYNRREFDNLLKQCKTRPKKLTSQGVKHLGDREKNS